MATEIYEFFGYPSLDVSDAARSYRASDSCPFLGEECEKKLNDGTISGVCSLKPATSDPVICCPIRLYADRYRVLQEISDRAFGSGLFLLDPVEARVAGEVCVAVFGRRWGGELRLPQRQGTGGYFVDWILAKLDENGNLVEFVAVEVQSIDTTGNYRGGITALRENPSKVVRNTAGFNWENVNKRILPQLIYKGHVLQREPLCKKGLFFVCPEQVHARIVDRLGGPGALAAYPLQSSSLTMMWWDIGAPGPGELPPNPIVLQGEFTTNIGQVAQAFTAPTNLPDMGVYEVAIRRALD